MGPREDADRSESTFHRQQYSSLSLTVTVTTHNVVAIEVGQSPASVGLLWTYAHSPKLFPSIVDLPTVHLLFCRRRFENVSIELVRATESAGEGLDSVVDVAGQSLIVELECDKGKVSAAQAD